MQLTVQTAKRLLAISFFVVTTIFGLYSSPVGAFSGGPPAARTGAPALGTNAAELNCTACHRNNPLNDPGNTLTITAPDSYTLGADIPVTVTIQRTGVAKFGFQLTALDDQGNKAGELVPTDSRTQVQTGGSRQYINHTADGNAATETGKNTWTFTWKAPTTAVGRVVFYAAGNATNSSSSNAGDFISTTSKGLYAPGFAPQTITAVSAASFATNAASEAIMALFGTNLNPTGVSAATNPLPTTLGGLRVVVHDLTTHIERNAPLFYVGPTQINFQIPAGVTNGPASVSVWRDNTAFASGNITVTNVAPALFTFNANGQGVPAAVALRFKNGVASPSESVAQLVSGKYEPIAIDLGAADEQVFLSAFGTGFRNRGTVGTVSATIGGTNADVATAPQGQFVGLDQANFLIPRSLIGRGLVDVVLTVNGQPANTVQINIK